MRRRYPGSHRELDAEQAGDERPFLKPRGLLPRRVDVQSDVMIGTYAMSPAGIRLAEKLECRAGLPFLENCRRPRLTNGCSKHHPRPPALAIQQRRL
jgi:hypothetical protein